MSHPILLIYSFQFTILKKCDFAFSFPGCSPTERAQFNKNLIELFSMEFDRIPKPTQPKSTAYPGASKGNEWVETDRESVWNS